MSTAISIISGKGGSGKSLLTAVLGRAIAREGKNVLLIDLDIFVRGLTVMLFNYKMPQPQKGELTISDILGVYENNSNNLGPVEKYDNNFFIQRFFECDVLPAVKNISHPLDYDDRDLSDEKFCKEIIKKLINEMKGKYDYVLVDCRAGMDSLIAATCENSDFVISVAEDDEISRQTNSNLTKFIQYRKSISNVYSIINKTRKITNYDDVIKRSQQREEFSTLGVIPFDIEILEDFGTERFWTTVTETLYFRSLIDVWNHLSKFEQIQEISVTKYKFPPKIFMSPSQGRFSFAERMLRIYSIAGIIGGISFWIMGSLPFYKMSTYELTSLLLISFGVIALVLSTSGFQAFLKGKHEKSNK